VQLEVLSEGSWVAAVRYDNAHGFCHRDVLHPDGRQDKVGIVFGDVNSAFTYAIEDLRTNWQVYSDRYRRELES
jgi:hypothetical protein